MTSKSSFFKLLKENFLRRIWTAAFAVLVFFFVFPINMMLTADMYLKNQINMSVKEIEQAKGIIYSSFTSVNRADGGIFAVIVMFAVLTGITGFAYLHSRKKVDFYHSLPVSRTKLYAAVVVNSILMIAVPYLVMALLSAVITGIRTGYTGCVAFALVNFVYGMISFVLIYMTAVLAMMLTGRITTGLLGTAVFLMYGPMIVSLVYGMMDKYFWTFYSVSDKTERLMTYLSPLFWAMNSFVSAPKRAIVSAAAAVILCIVNVAVYRIRRSEAAGMPMAFKRTETVIKVFITIPAAVAAGLFFSYMTNVSDFWMVFAIVCGAVIVHSIIEIIYNSDFRKLFTHKLHLAGCMAAALAIFALFRFDLAGYDSYIPDESKVASAGAFSYSMDSIYGDEDYVELNNDNYSGGRYAYYTKNRSDKDVVDAMSISDISGIRDIAGCGANAAAEYASEGPKYGNAYYARDDQDKLSTILVAWHLNNGRTVYRQYSMDLHKVHDEVETLHDSIEFKKAVYPIINKNADDIADIVGVNFYDAFGPHHVTFNEAQGDELKDDISRLTETYIRELSGLTAETRRHEWPVTALQFKNSRFQSISDTVREDDGYIGVLNDTGYYPVYPSFRETLALLESYGVKINNGLNAADISTIIVSDANGYYTDDDGNTVSPKPDLIVSDKKQIQEILDSTVSMYASNVSNDLDPLYYGVGVNAYLTRSYKELGQHDADETVSDNIAENVNEAVFGADMAASDSGFAVGMSADKYVNGYYGGYDAEAVSSLSLTFEYDKIPQFVRDYFEINDNNSLKNTSGEDRW